MRAQLWYLRHALSLIDGAVLGLALGTIFGLWNIVGTLLYALADDTPAALLVFYGPMFTAWGIAGFVAARRSGRFIEAVKVGATVAFVTFAVFWVANLVRVNVFLHALPERADWQGLMVRYYANGSNNFRGFVNYEYLAGAPRTLLVPTIIGALTGVIGGLGAMAAGHRPAPEIPHQ